MRIERAFQSRPRALVLIPHKPVLDLRTERVAESLAGEYEVCEIGTLARPSLERITEHRQRVRVERTHHDCDWIPLPGDQANTAAQQLTWLFTYMQLPDDTLRRALGAVDANPAALDQFRQLCTDFVNTNSALIRAARLTGSFDVIVAADLITLPTALVLGRENSAVVVYDAHEYWADSDNDFQYWQIVFWSELERSLATEATIRVTVSPQLASRLTEDYGCAFMAVPNCAALMDAAALKPGDRVRERSDDGEVVFLYQGGFAPGRGIEHLIHAWAEFRGPERLLLRGPDNDFKTKMERLAARLRLRDRRVFFPHPVSNAKLIEAAAEADVGLIPYDPGNPKNRLSCPNNLSQYLAAGLPVIANELEFVRQVVQQNELGAVVSFRDTEKLVRTIERFARREMLADMSARAQAYFRSEFNWEAASARLFAEIRSRLGSASPASDAEYDFSWVEAGRDMRELPCR